MFWLLIGVLIVIMFFSGKKTPSEDTVDNLTPPAANNRTDNLTVADVIAHNASFGTPPQTVTQPGGNIDDWIGKPIENTVDNLSPDMDNAHNAETSIINNLPHANESGYAFNGSAWILK